MQSVQTCSIPPPRATRLHVWRSCGTRHREGAAPSARHSLVEASGEQVAALVVHIHAGNELAVVHLQHAKWAFVQGAVSAWAYS